ncbi:MAG: fibronectin type III domain-containing protein [Gemmatimonadales bacterium]|jgi:hypothetical protein
MARFPESEAEIFRLAQDLINGFRTYAEDYPTPPVPVEELEHALAAYVTARTDAVAGAAAAKQGTDIKEEALESLTGLMKANIRYAETTTEFDDGKLRLIGWGGRAARTSLEPPGQVRSLEVVREGEDWIMLDWKAPSDGGKVAAYRIQRRPRGEGVWQDASMAVETELLLSGQERGVDLEYQVMAVNRSGEGLPGNIVTAVL